MVLPGHLEADGFELPSRSADLDRIVIDEEADLLAAELLPMIVAAIVVVVARRTASVGWERARQGLGRR